MLDRETGMIKKINYEDDEFQELIVSIENIEYKAMNFVPLSGRCELNNRVLLNTTAIRLKLGTGGYHYVIANLDGEDVIQEKKGHIMKMRYTPLQMVSQTMEEQGSPHHEEIKGFTTLKGMPVIVGSLHSMLAPIVSFLKYHDPNIKITYIMSDGASLPISISKSVRDLKSKGLIDATITYGHAFGGDFEAVNIYTALIGAMEVTKCDVAIVVMGPGIVGTGTKYGFTGIEQAGILDAVNALGGFSIAIPRISFADKRERHSGLSHHSITTFSNIVQTSTNIVFPKLKDSEKMKTIQDQVIKGNLSDAHNIEYRSIENLEEILNSYHVKVSTMGRNYLQDPEFFQSAAAAALFAFEKISKEGRK